MTELIQQIDKELTSVHYSAKEKLDDQELKVSHFIQSMPICVILKTQKTPAISVTSLAFG